MTFCIKRVGIEGARTLGDVCVDLSKATFCVPLSDSMSPIAHAVMNETYWYHPDVKHTGVESVLRYANWVTNILGGRQLAKDVREYCTKCRILNEAVKVTMRAILDCRLCVAPAFCNSQVNISGPFDAYSKVNKRATIKIWYVVFVVP